MVGMYFYNDYTGKQQKYDREQYADSTLKEHVWQIYHILGIRNNLILILKGIVSVVFVGTLVKKTAMTAHAV